MCAWKWASHGEVVERPALKTHFAAFVCLLKSLGHQGRVEQVCKCGCGTCAENDLWNASGGTSYARESTPAPRVLSRREGARAISQLHFITRDVFPNQFNANGSFSGKFAWKTEHLSPFFPFLPTFWQTETLTLEDGDGVCFPFAHSEKECDVIFLLNASAPEIIQFPAALGVEVCESGEGGCTWGIFKLILFPGELTRRDKWKNLAWQLVVCLFICKTENEQKALQSHVTIRKYSPVLCSRDRFYFCRDFHTNLVIIHPYFWWFWGKWLI